MIVVSGFARIRSSMMNPVVASARTMSATSRSEAGCVASRFAVDVDDPEVVHQFEVWESQDALDAHFRTTHFADLVKLMAEAIDGESEFVRYDVSATEVLFG